MRKIILTGLLISILIFAGCGEKKDSGQKLEDPFIGGTTGILISFIEDSPPPEAYAGGDYPFDVVVKLKNDGEYKVPKEKAKVTISGINAQEFGKEEIDFVQNPPEDLEPRRKEDGKTVDSAPVHTEFYELNRVEDFSGNTYTIRANVCYEYGTDAISKICIRSNNLDYKEGVCTVNEEKKVHSSSAPLQITDFKETARAKNKVAFTFTIEHKGNGQIYKLESDCGKENRRANQDRAWVEVSTGLDGLECTGLRDGTATSGYTTLYGGDKIITCTQTIDTNSDYEKPVEIELIYDYKDNAETSILIKSAGGN